MNPYRPTQDPPAAPEKTHFAEALVLFLIAAMLLVVAGVYWRFVQRHKRYRTSTSVSGPIPVPTESIEDLKQLADYLDSMEKVITRD